MSVSEQELEIQELRTKASQYEAYKRLVVNPDFKLIIRDLFMVQQCSSNVRKSTQQSEDADKYLLREAQAAGYLEGWLQRVGNELSSASYAMAQYDSDPESYLSDNTEITIVDGVVNVTKG